jgi:hypothetical protein
MMQNIRDGQPVVFKHDCPSERNGKIMSENEYYSFLEDMVDKCFSFAELNLIRLRQENDSKGFWSKFFKKEQVSPIFRLPHCLGGDGYCDFVIAKSVQEYEEFCNIESSDFAKTYKIDNGNWLKVLRVDANNVDHPGDFINGDRYTIQIFSRNMYPKQGNNPIVNTLSDNNLLHQVGEAWRTLNVNALAPYLDKDFHYSSDFVFTEISSKEEYLFYLKAKFQAFSEIYGNKIKIKYGINGQEDTNKIDGIYIRLGEEESVAYLQVFCKNGRIAAMGMHESTIDLFTFEKGWTSPKEESAFLQREQQYINSRFSFEKYDDDFRELNKIAYDCLNNYFDSLGMEYGHGWSWLQIYPQQMSFQHLCISYKSYVLCIIIGLYRVRDGHGQIYVSKQYEENLQCECEKYNLTPCIFVIDCADGSPCYKEPYLIDARTYEEINLEKIQEDNDGVMSEWEINNIGIQCACEYLKKQGAVKISYSDVIGINPQIWFEKDGEHCYAFVRSIPAGLSKEKFQITTGNLNRFSESKGYFFDVQWNMMLGNNGNFRDKQMFREYNPWNLVHWLDFKPLDEAIKEYDFIEIVEGESFEIK